MKNLFGEIISLAGDIFLGTPKSIAELIRGKDLITQEPLGIKGTIFSIVGAIPVIGPFLKVKTIKRCTKLAKGIIKTLRVVKKPNEYITNYQKGELGFKIILGVGCALKSAQQSISEVVDYIRYDNGLLAAAIRTIDKAACTVAAPVINFAQNTAKTAYYGTGRLLGKSDNEMQQSLDKIDDAFSTGYDQIIDKLSTINYSGRLFSDIGLAFSHVIAYANISSLSDEGLAKIQGFNDEAARRYNKNKNNEIYPDDPKWDEWNKQKAKFNTTLDKARRKAIRDDLKKNGDKVKNPIPINLPFFDGGFLSKLFGYFGRLFRNAFWLMGHDLMNWWGNKFGKEGYGFHTCPYGCGRPIPDSFYGCSELLAAFPDYFN